MGTTNYNNLWNLLLLAWHRCRKMESEKYFFQRVVILLQKKIIQNESCRNTVGNSLQDLISRITAIVILIRLRY